MIKSAGSDGAQGAQDSELEDTNGAEEFAGTWRALALVCADIQRRLATESADAERSAA